MLSIEHLRLQSEILEILIVGLGGGCLTNYISRQYPDSKITSVDIDPEMIDVAKKYFNVIPGPNSGGI